MKSSPPNDCKFCINGSYAPFSNKISIQQQIKKIFKIIYIYINKKETRAPRLLPSLSLERACIKLSSIFLFVFQNRPSNPKPKFIVCVFI